MATDEKDGKQKDERSLHPPLTRVDLSRATFLTNEVVAAVEDQFEYHPWNEEKVGKGAQVKRILIEATLFIIRNVPPCPDRSAALRKIREARMDCNSAITHDGKY